VVSLPNRRPAAAIRESTVRPFDAVPSCRGERAADDEITPSRPTRLEIEEMPRSPPRRCRRLVIARDSIGEGAIVRRWNAPDVPRPVERPVATERPHGGETPRAPVVLRSRSGLRLTVRLLPLRVPLVVPAVEREFHGASREPLRIDSPALADGSVVVGRALLERTVEPVVPGRRMDGVRVVLGVRRIVVDGVHRIVGVRVVLGVRRIVVDGERRIVGDRVVDGVRRIVGDRVVGERRIVGVRVVDGERRIVGDERRTVGDERRTVGERETDRDGERDTERDGLETERDGERDDGRDTERDGERDTERDDGRDTERLDERRVWASRADGASAVKSPAMHNPATAYCDDRPFECARWIFMARSPADLRAERRRL